VVLSVMLLTGAGTASGGTMAVQTVHYDGYVVQVPRSWPVYDLTRSPRTCVRFNRHALYLGDPSAHQSCPAHAAGRTEAILITPQGAASARTARAVSAARLAASVSGEKATSFRVRGLRVIATWARDRATIVRALHRASLPPVPVPRAGSRPAAARAARLQPHQAGEVYTGLGFDACSAPSPQTMTAWTSSPYRAIGIYIGGDNAACAQPNLTPTWTSSEVAAGWHLIPTYVGLQAPSNSCGCASISPTQASTQGTAAADDAVAMAQSVGIPAGNPIYDDMESYSRTSANTSAVLVFLSSWTSELHAKGYLSGVYSSADSGIADLVSQYGSAYVEPDELWIADWNGQQTTSDPAVPASQWANHQRLHQYRGGHDETYGGYTINIDNDYLDGATADSTSGSPPPPPPTLAISPAADGTTSLSAKWSAGTGLASWLALAGANATSLTAVGQASAHGSGAQITVRTAAPYFAVQALGSSGQVLANSSTVATPAFVAVYGHSAFVNVGSGVGGIPAGCYTSAPCHVMTTITSGRTVIATTGTESIASNGTGILFFKLTSPGRKALARAPAPRLPVRVNLRDSAGSSATIALNLIPFATSGKGPPRRLVQSQAVRIVGVTDFVFARGAGGILAGCVGVVPCPISAKLSIGRTTIATTKPELVGGNELGYVLFSLTRQGRSLLTHAAGNQLGVRLQLTSGTSAASGQIALVQFS
jgi:hypothetical protein